VKKGTDKSSPKRNSTRSWPLSSHPRRSRPRHRCHPRRQLRLHTPAFRTIKNESILNTAARCPPMCSFRTAHDPPTTERSTFLAQLQLRCLDHLNADYHSRWRIHGAYYIRSGRICATIHACTRSRRLTSTEDRSPPDRKVLEVDSCRGSTTLAVDIVLGLHPTRGHCCVCLGVAVASTAIIWTVRSTDLRP
jgi:hypothetical protein